MTIVVQSGVLRGAPVTTGPLDVRSANLVAAFGVRPLSAAVAAAGGNLFTIVKSDDTASQAINATTSGHQDVAAIDAWRAANGNAIPYLTSLHDQPSGAYNFGTATSGQKPQMEKVGGYYRMKFIQADAMNLFSPYNFPTLTPPFSFSMVLSIYDDSVSGYLFVDNANTPYTYYTTGTDAFYISEDTNTITTATSSVVQGNHYSFQCVSNGASPASLVALNGTATTGTQNSAGYSDHWAWGRAFGQCPNAYLSELIIYSGALTSTEYSTGTISNSITTNQMSYWGI